MTVKAPHAHLVELGTAPHINAGKLIGTQHPGTAQQPFVRPAWVAEKNATIERIAKALGNEIMRAARRAANKAATFASPGAQAAFHHTPPACGVFSHPK
ncbi:hypothetical protein [Rhodobacter sp. 24-YEA-8]|uniref:hypothetical protein n=1 Tax=Rhodobacter sp. 24-YEA-8 TaxID=1884310 RepID=UPI000B89D46E|nr:hypothetical protein [Rhodobacter sp. 24-YEA-8]